MNESAIISFNELSKYYNGHIGIVKLDFSVNKGDIYGFLGPNGAGKTTTIKLILDLLKPSSGSVHIFGKEVSSNAYTVRQKTGYLPGDFTPYGKMTGYEFLQFCFDLRQLDMPMPEELFSRFKLRKKDLEKKIKAYSQGMKQKIGIIQAVAHKPPLIILDEPSTGLDPLIQESLYELLLELNDQGCTIFFSSHNLPEVEKICSKVAIVKDGRMVGNESLDSLRKKQLRKLRIRLSSSATEAPVLKGARFVKKHNNEFSYLIEGDVKQLIEQINALPLEDLVFPEADLEDIFMAYYEKENKKQHA